jgi:putative addiction module CopG family antidote
MVRMIKTRVASGQYASESEVVRDGLRTLQARDAAIERWLRSEVAESYDSYKTDPSNVVPAAKMMSRLRARRRKRQTKTR